MRIEDHQQEEVDFDWFAVDERGEIAHFATAGFKKLPMSVAASAEDLELVTDYFLREAPVRGHHNVDLTLVEEIAGWKGEGSEARYLRSFVAMADRGLFSFDIASYIGPATDYIRVATPTSPMHVSELPASVRVVVSRTSLKGAPFSKRARIPYTESLHL